MRWNAQVVFALVLPMLTACSSASNSVGGTAATATQQSAAAENGCKDFPVPIYPSKTSCSCSQSGDRFTASVETGDSVEQVTKFYQTKVQSDGWELAPDPLISPNHTVITIKNGTGHAVVSTFAGPDGKGCSFQINAYPKGSQ